MFMKNIVIVGNGNIKNNYGIIIDKFNCICRINNFVLDGYYNKVGHKTNIISIRYDHIFKNFNIFKFFDIVDKIIIFIVNETKINNDISFNKIKEKYYYKLFLIHENKINNLIKELNPNINFNINGKVYSLSTGIMTILYFMFLNNEFDNIYICGFDFGKSGHYYNEQHNHSKIHLWDIERNIINKFINNKKLFLLNNFINL